MIFHTARELRHRKSSLPSICVISTCFYQSPDLQVMQKDISCESPETALHRQRPGTRLPWYWKVLLASDFCIVYALPPQTAASWHQTLVPRKSTYRRWLRHDFPSFPTDHLPNCVAHSCVASARLSNIGKWIEHSPTPTQDATSLIYQKGSRVSCSRTCIWHSCVTSVCSSKMPVTICILQQRISSMT